MTIVTWVAPGRQPPGHRWAPSVRHGTVLGHDGAVMPDQTCFDDRDLLPVVALIGPTASGKTTLGTRLAARLNSRAQPAEIVNADSMLVYRGMDIGTAKPSSAERAAVPHHLIDTMAVTENASVAEFQRVARAAIADCRGRGVIPILVGGSALYVHAILDEFEFPGTDPATRARLEGELSEFGASAMHRRLAAVDPRAAQAILPGNGRRIVRALEVNELTGGPFAAELPQPRYALTRVVQVGVVQDRADRDQRIADRVHRMWRDGLVDEVRGLMRDGLREGRTASRALGYRQVLQHLEGEFGEDEAQQRTIRQTRKFARRQDSWFRRDERIDWIPVDEGDPVEAVYRRVRAADL